ncbi:MAG: hypothetical protein HY763_09350 [Planctomycetes bacterium]|nr:hypothetical protein [Planctomycetota bacterium]
MGPRAHRRRGRDFLTGAPLGLLLTCPLLVGCAGGASIHVITLEGKRLNLTGPLLATVHVDECYHWVDDQGRVCVAMRGTRGSLLGARFSREFVLSMVAPGVPAGTTRGYTATRQTLRTKTRSGYSHSRAASLSGALVLWDWGKATLRGRLRVIAKQQAYSVLSGWSNDGRVLLLGEFRAVRNRRQGEGILARTEEGGMARASEPVPAAKTEAGAPQ